jgi:hypothetical protein
MKWQQATGTSWTISHWHCVEIASFEKKTAAPKARSAGDDCPDKLAL